MVPVAGEWKAWWAGGAADAAPPAATETGTLSVYGMNDDDWAPTGDEYDGILAGCWCWLDVDAFRITRWWDCFQQLTITQQLYINSLLKHAGYNSNYIVINTRRHNHYDILQRVVTYSNHGKLSFGIKHESSSSSK